MDLINGMIAFALPPLAAASSLPELPSYIAWLFPVVVIGVAAMFLWNSVISLYIYRLSKFDRDVDGLKKELHEVAAKLVDERFRSMSHSINNHVQNFTSTLDKLSLTVREKEREIKDLSAEDWETRLQFTKDTATKEDLRRHEDKVEEKLTQITDKIDEFKEAAVTKSDLKTFLRDCGK